MLSDAPNSFHFRLRITKDHIDWLEAHIALQREMLKGLSASERKNKEGHVALLEARLRVVRKALRKRRK